MQRMLVCLSSCLLAVALPAQDAAPSHAEALVKTLTAFGKTMAEGSAEARAKALAGLLPTREDVATLFPKHVDLFWKQLDAHNQRMLGHSEEIAREWNTGENTRIEAIDVRERDEPGTYRAVLGMIPNDIPVFRVVRRTGKRSAGSSSYLFIGGRWIHLQGLEMIPNIIRAHGQ